MAKVTDKIKRIQRARKILPFKAKLKADKKKEVDYEIIVEQIEQEYQLSLTTALQRTQRWLERLTLYNNQVRDKTKVGYPLVYQIHQIVHANLFDDRLSVTFKGREEGDADNAENLTSLASFDYSEMQKDQHDEAWNFDAEIFGAGYSLFNNFDVATKTPIPQIIDPTIVLRDPMASSINGDRSGDGASRWFMYEFYATKYELEANPSYVNLDKLVMGNDELSSLTAKARRARNKAQGRPTLDNWENLTENYKYAVLRTFTHIGGELCLVELANNRTQVIRYQKMPKGWGIPVIKRNFSPIAHDWDGVSIMDLLEDKQRYGAKILNLAGELVQADLNGMWIYRGQGFRKNQDFNFKFGKWIEFNGKESLEDAAKPLQMKQVSQGAQYVMDWLAMAAQKAAGTPEVKQGAAGNNISTLGENLMISAGSDTRYSLTSKIYGWSERQFWYQYYKIYEEYFGKGMGAKIARLEGPFGTKWKSLYPKNLITVNSLGPDIEIESRVITEAKKAQQLQQVQVVLPIVQQNPQADKMYFDRKVFKLIWPKDEVERIFPVTNDEYQARDENDKLNDEEYVKVKVTDNHVVHLREHASAKDNKHTLAHIKAHRFMIEQKRALQGNPMSSVFPQMPEDQQNQQQQNGSQAKPNLVGGKPIQGAVAQPMQ